MGNCLNTNRVNCEAQSSDAGERVKNGGWKRKLAKTFGFARFSARVDVPSADNEPENLRASISEAEYLQTESDVMDDDNNDEKEIENNELEEADSLLILCYARSEEADDTADKPTCVPSSVPATERDSPYFSTSMSTYDEFIETGSEDEIEEEIDEVDEEEMDDDKPEIVDKLGKNTQQQIKLGGDKLDTEKLTGFELNEEIINENKKDAYKQDVDYKERKEMVPGINEIADDIVKTKTQEKTQTHFYATSAKMTTTAPDLGDDNIEEEILEEIPEEISNETDDTPDEADDGKADDIDEITKSSSTIGSGEVVMENNTIEEASKRIRLLKQAISDPVVKVRNKMEDKHVIAVKSVGNAAKSDTYKTDLINISDHRQLQNIRPTKSCQIKGESAAEEPESPSLTGFRKFASAVSLENNISEELKKKISLTSQTSLEKIKTHKERSDCKFEIFVRSAEPGSEPRKIKVRASSQQVNDGAARVFVKSMGKITDPVVHFDPCKQRKKKKKQHIDSYPGLVRTEQMFRHKWIQRPGPATDVNITKVPTFYEPPAKQQNARERFGLEFLQKHKIQIQCKPIERIKIDEEQFPGILPPKLLEHWRRKRREKKMMN